MKKQIVMLLFVTMFILSCGSGEPKKTLEVSLPVVNNDNEELVQVQAHEITLEELLGKWMQVTIRNEIESGDNCFDVWVAEDKYMGGLQYQNYYRAGTVQMEEGAPYFIADSGEQYRINTITARPNDLLHHSISLDFITGIDDIGLGFFQREDIIKQRLLEKE